MGKIAVLATADIFFARSTDGGLTFSEPPENISENTGNSLRPQISSDGDNVYVVWQSADTRISSLQGVPMVA